MVIWKNYCHITILSWYMYNKNFQFKLKRKNVGVHLLNFWLHSSNTKNTCLLKLLDLILNCFEFVFSCCTKLGQCIEIWGTQNKIMYWYFHVVAYIETTALIYFILIGNCSLPLRVFACRVHLLIHGFVKDFNLMNHFRGITLHLIKFWFTL